MNESSSTSYITVKKIDVQRSKMSAEFKQVSLHTSFKVSVSDRGGSTKEVQLNSFVQRPEGKHPIQSFDNSRYSQQKKTVTISW